MADSNATRRRALLIVLGVIVGVLAAFLVVALAQGGDDTDQIDPQNSGVVTLLPR